MYVRMVTGLIKESNTTICEILDRSDYEHFVWTAAAEFPGQCVITNCDLAFQSQHNHVIFNCFTIFSSAIFRSRYFCKSIHVYLAFSLRSSLMFHVHTMKCW